MNFSDTFKKTISIAQNIAKEYGHGQFSAAHLLFAILHKDVNLEEFLIEKLDIDIFYLREWADVRMEEFPKKITNDSVIKPDEKAELAIEEADMVRVIVNEDELEPIHLLIAIVTPGVAFSFDQLRTLPLQRETILKILSEQNLFESSIVNNESDAETNSGIKKKAKTNQALLSYCKELVELAKENKIDPIIGREYEIRTISEIFGRRLKPNVILVGEPGVGKTALVDGLAIAMAQNDVPPFLKNAKLFELDNGALVAGASYKGEIEERLKNILSEIKNLDKAILFIDEIHVLMDKNGAFNGAANLLKPELARGEITIIGATTIEEYQKYIEKDDAFSRRFEMLKVAEPDDEVAFKMLQGLIPLYSKHHDIDVKNNTIKSAIKYARRYIKDRKLPDAGIDLLDRTMSALKLTIDTGGVKLEKYHADYKELLKKDDLTVDDLLWHYKQLKSELSIIVWNIINSGDDLTEYVDVKLLTSKLDSLYKKLLDLFPFKRKELVESDVASIVAEKTGIPLGKIQVKEKDRLLQMPEIIKRRLIGQDQAVNSISEAILEARAGLGKPGQPIGSFFFLGPTGTGKTEMAKSLAEFLFQSEANIIRFDMSEFKEEHSAALLYGAPPGYVGYEEGGLLVNKIRQQPYSIVLFDEIEKAHASVFDIFLQILDEGKLHDKLGKEGDFSNALIIFTSNIGSQFIVDNFNKGIVPNNNILLEKMSSYFRPEFLGRITEIIPFAPMNIAMVRNIFKIQLRSLFAALEKQNIKLEIDEQVASHLSELGFNPQYGARPLNGIIRNYLRRPLAKKIISGQLKNGDTITLKLNKKKELVWK